MICVVGEALVDLVIAPDGTVDAKLGGAPFNTARACARLGADVRFVGAISEDRFGTLLTGRLADDGVDVSEIVRVEAPTTLAAAELDERGAATYRFYLDGTSAPALPMLADAALDAEVLFTGGLGLVLEPMAAAVEDALARSRDRFVVVDVNCRPRVVADRASYVARVDRVLRHAHLVKVSDEDLSYLRPGMPAAEAAASLLEHGPSAVLLTRGGDAVDVIGTSASATVPIAPVEVIDTIGAGDSFGGGFLAWWTGHGFGRAESGSIDLLVRAVRAANAVAGVVVGRRGANPPWRAELPDDWSD